MEKESNMSSSNMSSSKSSKKIYKITKKSSIKSSNNTSRTITKKNLKKNSKIDEKSKSEHSSSSSRMAKYIPSSVNEDIIVPKYWELPNRKTFYNWIMDTFGSYELGNIKRQRKYIKRISQHFELSNIQRVLRDYLQSESPVRGMLLYLGLGSGKTCTGVTIAEAIKTKKKVVLFSKAVLEGNWIKEIKNCGGDYYKNSNWWVFKHSITDEILELATTLGIPHHIIKKNNGIFLVDFTKDKSNFTELDAEERSILDEQISATIDARFEFIHSNNTRLWNTFDPESVNGKVLIWDEVHNLGNNMASNSQAGARFYNMFMNAKDVRIIFLSATPIVNRIFEITKIYNILRGYINVLEITFRATYDAGIDYDKIKYNLKKNQHIDQIIVNKAKKKIQVTRNPEGFITDPNNRGLLYRQGETKDVTNETFLEEITEIIQSMGYKSKIEWLSPRTLFPEDEEEFEQMFYNRELNKLKKLDLIKHRIAGLTSYYEYQDPANYPKLIAINKVQFPMSEYQFGTYERYRSQELLEERNARKRNVREDEEMSQSSYRLKSRLACTLVFPEEIGNPYDTKTGEERIEHIEMVGARLSTNFDINPAALELMNNEELKKLMHEKYLKVLEKRKAEYLDINNGSLAKYSPKYLTMILNINKNAPTGKVLVYSFFTNLIGLQSFSYALIQTGKWAPFRIRKVNKQWEIDEREDERELWKFVFYSGNEKPEERDIYRKILNTEWDTLGADCEKLKSQLRTIHPNNYYGEVIKMMMITQSGAEGLDLAEIRYIHLMETTWQHVAIDQIIGRGVRNKSHLRLPEKDRTVEAWIYMATLTPNLVRKISYIDVRNDVYRYPNPALAEKANRVVTSDEYLYLTAEKKRVIINEFQRLMKESAFDCALNYHDNKLRPENANLVCMDYNSKNRDDYLSTPLIGDDSITVGQDKIVIVKYGSFKYKNHIYFYETIANAAGKMYIYDENPVGRVRAPKPVGEVLVKEGAQKYAFYPKKRASKAK
jgi:hypothetical protein